jgi:hypothetical protein
LVFVVCFGSTGVWNWGLMISRQACVTLLALFCIGYFQDRVSRTICPG